MAAPAYLLPAAVNVGKGVAQRSAHLLGRVAERAWQEGGKEAVGYRRTWTSKRRDGSLETHEVTASAPRWAVGIALLAGGYLYFTQTGALRQWPSGGMSQYVPSGGSGGGGYGIGLAPSTTPFSTNKFGLSSIFGIPLL